MAQIDTHIPPATSIAMAFHAFGKVATRYFRQIGDRQAATSPAQDRLSQPNMENHMLWDHGMTRSDLSRMLDHTHR